MAFSLLNPDLLPLRLYMDLVRDEPPAGGPTVTRNTRGARLGSDRLDGT